MPHIAYIALGSNLGERAENIRRAIELLGKLGEIRAISDTKEYPAVDSPSGSPPFLNSAAILETLLTPRDLLAALLGTEKQMGRVREIKNEPRIIDLDLLMYDRLQLDEPDLQLPHPRMHQRKFVLEPLSMIGGDLIHPTLNKSVAQLFSELP